ncbi:PREDICTED: putative disease resistance protein RGA3 [Nelumbo nucifera]|uniref:Disease resistance protein RGA3 n=2 Tax=Nelumbo nucifera TaxID=4432 RepID=A0A1U8B5D7_NELNU|nr:PREDICTED: putative disease resistance protein RGA3 [Nelumbo nucifera]DAD32219.1 TPA_asm: hypothetical protein HUJ06_011070 [Nelumbo nucifera]
MGGIGKTTLAQIVYNDPTVENHFHLRAWVCASEDFDVKRLTKQVIESITYNHCELDFIESLQVRLRKILKGRRLLLVLDDLGSDHDEDCWLLFKQQAFSNGKPHEHPNLEAIGRKIVEKCKGLPLAIKTLAGYVNHGKIPSDLFEELRFLRVLDLSWTDLKRIPDSICELKHLRYLDLSATRISVLPESMCNLFNLQILRLIHCYKLRKLLENMRSLINLQYLFVSGDFGLKERSLIQETRTLVVLKQPRGIGRLTYLKTLPYFVVGQDDGFMLGELKTLQHLHGKLSISKLENVTDMLQAKEANLKEKKRLNELEFQWSDVIGNLQDGGDTDAVLESLQPHTGLKGLTIRSYPGISFPNWMMMGLVLQWCSLRRRKCPQCLKILTSAVAYN